MKVQFRTAAAWRGRSIRKGEVLEMDAASGRAYIAVDQAVEVVDEPENPVAKAAEKPTRQRHAKADDE